MKARIALLSAACLALAGCSSGGDGEPPASEDGASPAASSAVAADLRPFVDACLASSNLDRAMCECTAQKAKDLLTGDGFIFLTATLARDEPRIEEYRGRLDVQEMMKAGTFMTRGPADCAAERAGIADSLR